MLLLSSRRILPVRCWHCCSGAGGHRDVQDAPGAAGLCRGDWAGVILTTVSPWRGGSAHGFLWGLEAMSRGCHPPVWKPLLRQHPVLCDHHPCTSPSRTRSLPVCCPHPVSQAALLQARQWQEEEKKKKSC